jgi:transcription initiation factor IIE alpha subunit
MEDNLDPIKKAYQEYYGGLKEAKEEEQRPVFSSFHRKVLRLLDNKVNTSDKIAEKLKVRENDVRRALNEMLIEKLVAYKKTTRRGKLAYIWTKNDFNQN